MSLRPSVPPSFRPSVLPSFRPSVLPSPAPNTSHRTRAHSRTHFCLPCRAHHGTYDRCGTATARSPADRFPIATHFRKTHKPPAGPLPGPHPMPPYSPAPALPSGHPPNAPVPRIPSPRTRKKEERRAFLLRRSGLRRAAYSNAAQALTVCSAMRVRPASVSFSF